MRTVLSREVLTHLYLILILFTIGCFLVLFDSFVRFVFTIRDRCSTNGTANRLDISLNGYANSCFYLSFIHFVSVYVVFSKCSFVIRLVTCRVNSTVTCWDLLE